MQLVEPHLDSRLELALYSKIISPTVYNRITSQEHVYIGASDRYIRDLIKRQIKNDEQLELIEIGCGPGRLFSLISQIEKVNYTAVDYDKDFIAYTKKTAEGQNIDVQFSDITTYTHGKPVDLLFSQGMHHHVSKGKDTNNYLKNVYELLREGGLYIVSDEFIPDYADENERVIKLVIWYSHVIADALKNEYLYLAQEEAKILLDDIQSESANPEGFKNDVQIKKVLARATSIDTAALAGDLASAQELAKELIKNVWSALSISPCGDNALDLSRGDHKISDRAFREEVEVVGFVVDNVEKFGPINQIGGMAVYSLVKEASKRMKQ